MRIERIERLGVGRYLFVRIHTDAGITGLGEAGMWGYLEANDAIIAHWEQYLVGQDPLLIEHHWNYLYRNAHFRGSAVTGALGAIDSALWDIMGKHLAVPVYQLLGGKVRDRVRVQTQIDAPTIDEVVANARREVGRGITALRITPFAPDFASQRYDATLKEAVKRVSAVREAVGSGVDIGIEIHRRLSPGDAITMAHALEPFHILYFEDPILPDSVQSCAEVARAIRQPVATGERLNSLFEFRELLVCGGARYMRVDPCLVGGISVAKKIANLAESFHAGVMPHGALGPVATAIAVQLDASTPNFVVQDYLGDDRPPKNDFLAENLKLQDGYLVLPERPGIGVELKEGLPEKYPFALREMRTTLHEDGSVADR